MKLKESAGGTDSGQDEKEMEREMMAAVKRTLDFAREVPGDTHPATGIDVRSGPDPEKYGALMGRGEKDALAVYPADTDDTSRLYLRSQKTGEDNDGRSIRAYETKHRRGRREGQYVQVTTDYESKDDKEFDRPKGSTTQVHVRDKDGNLIRQKKHTSDGVGLSPLVTKIVTKGIDKQIQNIKDIEDPPTLF
jgi:hypothetical protein